MGSQSTPDTENNILMGHLYTYVVLGVGLAPSHGTIRHGTEERGICTRSQMMVVQHLHL